MIFLQLQPRLQKLHTQKKEGFRNFESKRQRRRMPRNDEKEFKNGIEIEGGGWTGAGGGNEMPFWII